MGKISSQPEPTITHFSHPHPLQLHNYQPEQTLNLASCSGCKLNVTGWVYTCTTCNYFLHIKCSKMPQQITHPFDQGHVLTLIPVPTYPEGCFRCDACGLKGNSFSYHCKACNIDLHMLCATTPLILTHPSHHHQLNLTFSPPYVNKCFSCDICRNTGLNHWLYRCNVCEFDAHLDCAREKARVPVQGPPCAIQPIQMQQYQSTIVPGIPQFQVQSAQYTARPNLQYGVANNTYGNNTSVNGGYGRSGRQGNILGTAAHILLPLLTGIGGGGNLFQGLGGGGRGRGGGGGVNGGGGIGGGVNFLQGQNGGGGVDFLQGVNGGGGGGGGGGVDFSQGLNGGGVVDFSQGLNSGGGVDFSQGLNGGGYDDASGGVDVSGGVCDGGYYVEYDYSC